MNCFKLHILSRQGNIFTRGAINSRLHAAVEYLLNSNQLSIFKIKKQLPSPSIEKMSPNNTTITSQRLSPTIPDAIFKRFCQLKLGGHPSTLYQFMDMLLCGKVSFVRENSDFHVNFQLCKVSGV